MKIERSDWIRSGARNTREGFRRIFCSLFLLAAIVVAVGAVASPRANQALAGTIIVVTNTNDSGSGSLRSALAIANDGDTIDATGVFGTTLLTSGELQINHSVTINGPGAGSLAVNGNATSCVFENFASNVTISDLTITNGNRGGILNHGGLTLTGTSIFSNTDPSNGGGINSDSSGGTLTVTDSVISNNQAGSSANGGYGGGISARSGGTVTVSNSTISGNRAVRGGFLGSSLGGGIAMGLDGSATLSVTDSNISGNSAESSGGIEINGTLTVTNSVVSGNSASFSSGGINTSGTATVMNSTISGNSFSCVGGGIAASGQLTVVNSTISGNGSLSGDGGFGCASDPQGGGGILNNGTATVINSTISENHADFSGTGAGGGIFHGGALTVTNSTISDNTAAIGGGAVYNTNGGTANIGDTVLNAGAFSGTILNDSGTVTSLGYNLASDDGGGV
jgi:hypothetical protein